VEETGVNNEPALCFRGRREEYSGLVASFLYIDPFSIFLAL